MKKYILSIPLINSLFVSFQNLYKFLFFIQEFQKFKLMLSKGSRTFDFCWKDRYPCLNEKTAHTEFDSHYIYHTSWAARVLSEHKPDLHYDISSSLYFAGIASAFVPIRFFDHRPANLALSNLESKKVDLMSLPFEDKSIKSLSCMHVVEHIGLGRYGDPMDSEGDLKAAKELKRVLSERGKLFFVVPVGKPAIYYNAHRVYSYAQVVAMFHGLKLASFSLIKDNGDFIGRASEDLVKSQKYACGCFLFEG